MASVAVNQNSASGAKAVVKVTDTDANQSNADAVVVLNAAGEIQSVANTEYTEDAAAAANPVGGALILVRRDTLTAAEVTTDGDNVAAKATNKGELRTSDADALAALGVPAGAAVVTDANGTIQQYLRGLIVNGLLANTSLTGIMTNAQFLANLRSTAAFTSVNSANASTNILASNANRKGAVIVNTDANALYLDLTGGTAATTRYATALATGDEYEVPFGLTGLITGIWAADGAGAALVTEFS